MKLQTINEQVSVDVFQAGRLKLFGHEWHKLTSDPIILDMVEHFHVDFFESFYSVHREESRQAHFNHRDSTVISEEIDKLLKIGVIKQVNYEPGQFILPIFVRPKGSFGGISYDTEFELAE